VSDCCLFSLFNVSRRPEDGVAGANHFAVFVVWS
jgi:hypothetical protein